MSDLREAAKQALEALIHMCHNTLADKGYDGQLVQDAIDGLKGTLAHQEQEPVAWIQSTHLQQAQRAPFLCRVEPTQRLSDFVPLYTHPPRREWQGLSKEERDTAIRWAVDLEDTHFPRTVARAIEQALKEKNA
jgi:hypothetical protein